MFGSGFNRNIIPKRFVKTIPKPPKFIGYISIPIHQTSLIGLKRGDISSDINDTVFNTIMG